MSGIRRSDPLANVASRMGVVERGFRAARRTMFHLLDISNDGGISFGNQTRQMINLWGTRRSQGRRVDYTDPVTGQPTTTTPAVQDSPYGIGVQSGTAYVRTGSQIAVFLGGSHVTSAGDPGPGGRRLIRLNSNGVTYFYSPDGSDAGYLQPVNGAELVLRAHDRLRLESMVRPGIIWDPIQGAYVTLTPEAWVGLSLSNGWVNFTGRVPARHRLNGAYIDFQGSVRNGTAGVNGQVLCTLSSGRRPPENITIPVANAGATANGKARFYITTSGQVQLWDVADNDELAWSVRIPRW